MADILPFPHRTPAPACAKPPLWRSMLGQSLRATREVQGDRLIDIAKRAGISPQYLSEIERGRKEPSSEMIAAVTGALGVELADLLDDILRKIRRPFPTTNMPTVTPNPSTDTNPSPHLPKQDSANQDLLNRRPSNRPAASQAPLHRSTGQTSANQPPSARSLPHSQQATDTSTHNQSTHHTTIATVQLTQAVPSAPTTTRHNHSSPPHTMAPQPPTRVLADRPPTARAWQPQVHSTSTSPAQLVVAHNLPTAAPADQPPLRFAA